VVRLTRMSIVTGKLSLQLFDRRNGQEDVRFERMLNRIIFMIVKIANVKARIRRS
jgi:hypothetical protein